MSQAVVLRPPSILPHPISYHRGEFAALITGVALVALAFILQNQNIIPPIGFYGLLAGAGLFGLISLIAFTKRYDEKYHFTKSDIEICRSLSVYLFNKDDARYALKSHHGTMETNVDREISQNFIDGFYKCGFGYENSPRIGSNFWGRTIANVRAQILYALRLESCGKTKVVSDHNSKLSEFLSKLHTGGKPNG